MGGVVFLFGLVFVLFFTRGLILPETKHLLIRIMPSPEISESHSCSAPYSIRSYTMKSVRKPNSPVSFYTKNFSDGSHFNSDKPALKDIFK